MIEGTGTYGILMLTWHPGNPCCLPEGGQRGLVALTPGKPVMKVKLKSFGYEVCVLAVTLPRGQLAARRDAHCCMGRAL